MTGWTQEDLNVMNMNTLLNMVIFAEERHRGQTRKSGTIPYISHPIAVAEIVSNQFNSTEDMVIAAVGHDLIEDTQTTLNELEERFGKTIASLIDELTDKFDKKSRPDLNRKERKALELERMGLMSQEAKVIKLADRLHNLRSRGLDVGHMFKNYIPETKKLLNAIGGANEHLKMAIEQEIETFIQENPREHLRS